MRTKKGKDGFSLVEMLLGLAIFSMIALTLYATYANGIKISRQSGRLEDIHRSIRWTFDSVTTDLENMVPFRYIDFYENPHGAFSGKSDRMSLLLATDSGLKVVRYQLKSPEETHIHKVIVEEATRANVDLTAVRSMQNERTQLLVRAIYPFTALMQSDKTEPAEEEILSDQIAEGGLKFSYAYMDQDAGQSLDWRDTWAEVFNPAGVRIEMTFLDPDNNRPWTLKKNVLIPTGSWGSQE